jgi:hypothetical protein
VRDHGDGDGGHGRAAPVLTATASADKTHAVVTELGSGGTPAAAYGVHVQVVC